MKEAAPLLLPLLRSRTQGDLLAWLFLHPASLVTLTALAGRVGVSVSTVSREVDRLAEAGLLVEQRIGTARLVGVDTESPLFRPLQDLLAVTFGPLPVLTDLLTGLPGIEEVFIYGSWAARYTGYPGPVPQDIDVLVVGTAKPERLDDIAAEAERRLRREVNVRTVKPGAWSDPDGNAFLAGVRSRPLVQVVCRGEVGSSL